MPAAETTEAESPEEEKSEEGDRESAPPPTSKQIAQRIGSLLIGLLLALVIGEIAVRIVASQSLIYNIEMVRYAKELKMPDPRGEVSHVHRPNASAHLMGVDISLNSLGHRGPDLGPKSPDRKRVFVLGSSVTMGWGIPYDRMFTSIVEKKSSGKIELANAGIGNYNTFAQEKLFEHQYAEVKPDLVVLHYFISDPEPRPKGNNSAILRHSYFAAYLYDRYRTLTLAAEGKNDLVKHYTDVYDDAQPYWHDTLRMIGEMRDAAAKDNVPFLVMIIPDFHNLKPGTPYGAIYEKIEKGFHEKGFHVINTFPVFQAKYGGNESALWIQPDDPHPNAVGHALMADLLFDELQKPDAFRLSK